MPTWDSTVDTWDSVTLLWHPTVAIDAATPINLIVNGNLRESLVLRASLPISFATSAKVARTSRYLGTAGVAFSFPLTRLSYSVKLPAAATTITFNTVARLGESVPIQGWFLLQFNIPNAPMKVSHNLYSAFSVNTYYPMARMLINAGYSVKTTVDFNVAGNFSRTSSRLFTGATAINFQWAIGPLYAITDLACNFGVLVDVPASDWYVGLAWPPSEIPEMPWIPEYPGDGPWIPVYPADGPWKPSLINLRNWIPVDDIGHFDG